MGVGSRGRSYLCVDIDDDVVASIGHAELDGGDCATMLTCFVFGCATCRSISSEPCNLAGDLMASGINTPLDCDRHDRLYTHRFRIAAIASTCHVPDGLTLRR